MQLSDHLRLMARYHVWALQRVYSEVDRLDESAYRRDCGLFFRSVHGTLNHLLVVERVWRERLLGAPRSIQSLDQILLDDRAELRDVLLADSREWGAICARLDAQADLDYLNMAGEPFALPQPMIPLHVFNHATHHRGQISTALTQLGGNAPVMDLPYFLLELPRQDWRH